MNYYMYINFPIKYGSVKTLEYATLNIYQVVRRHTLGHNENSVAC